MKNFKTCLLVILLLTTQAAFATESTGTTGGGDKDYDIQALLPRSIRIESDQTARHSGPAVTIGFKHCWGIIPCAIYAWQFTLTVDYDKEVSRSRGFQLAYSVDGKKGALVKHLSLADLLAELDGNDKENIKDVSQALSRYTDNNALYYYYYLNQSNRYFWQNEAMSMDQYTAHLDTIRNAAFARVDYESPKTITDLKVIDEFLIGLNVGGVIEPVKRQLKVQFNAQVDEIVAQAKKVVDEGTGTCDQAKYEQVKTRIRNFKFGTAKWLEKLSRESGVDFIELAAPFYQERGRIHQLMAEDVTPYCTSATGRPELNEADMGEPMLLKLPGKP